MNPSNGVTVYNHILDDDTDDPTSVTITDAMLPNEVIAALANAWGVDYVATLVAVGKQRVKAERMRKAGK